MVLSYIGTIQADGTVAHGFHAGEWEWYGQSLNVHDLGFTAFGCGSAKKFHGIAHISFRDPVELARPDSHEESSKDNE